MLSTPSGVKSIGHYVANMVSASTVDVTIAAVNLAKASIEMTGNTVRNGSAVPMPIGLYFLNTTTVRVYNGGGAADANGAPYNQVYFDVVEYV